MPPIVFDVVRTDGGNHQIVATCASAALAGDVAAALAKEFPQRRYVIEPSPSANVERPDPEPT